MKYLLFLFLLFGLPFQGVAQDKNFAKGADISWITQIEYTNKYKLVDETGKIIDGYQLLKTCGMNMVRLRAPLFLLLKKV